MENRRIPLESCRTKSRKERCRETFFYKKKDGSNVYCAIRPNGLYYDVPCMVRYDEKWSDKVRFYSGNEAFGRVEICSFNKDILSMGKWTEVECSKIPSEINRIISEAFEKQTSYSLYEGFNEEDTILLTKYCSFFEKLQWDEPVTEDVINKKLGIRNECEIIQGFLLHTCCPKRNEYNILECQKVFMNQDIENEVRIFSKNKMPQLLSLIIHLRNSIAHHHIKCVESIVDFFDKNESKSQSHEEIRTAHGRLPLETFKTFINRAMQSE